MRVDNKGCVFFAREERSAIPIRLLQIPVRRDRPDGPMLLFMLDEQAGGGDGGSALSYIETLLSLLPFGLAMADREGRFLFRSEERRVGKECVSTCRSRWSLSH